MKKILFTTIAVASLSAGAAHANEVFSDNSVTSPLGTVSTEAMQNLQNCLSADAEDATSKAIRACTKAYQASAPRYDVRSELLTRRGLLQLSNGRFDKASRDFKKAAKLNSENEFAYLGEGFAAVMQKDYDTAVQNFEDCRSHKKAEPLAIYGLAIAKEMMGQTEDAKRLYHQAAQLRPDWQAPREELQRLGA